MPLICKLAGSGVLFLAAAVCAGSALHAERGRLRRMDALIALLYYIREQVDRYLTPVPELIVHCAPALLAACLPGGRLPARLPGTMEELTGLICSGEYGGDGAEALRAFAAGFGRSFREQEVQACDRCVGELKALRERLASELPVRRRVRTVIGFCGVCAAVILLV